MDLELHVTRQYGLKYKSRCRYIKIAVVDLDKNSDYPKNFFCFLLLLIQNYEINQNSLIFLDHKAYKQLKFLLEKTLKNEKDIEVIKEIRKRLRQIELF